MDKIINGWAVLSIDTTKKGQARWLCRCICGYEAVVSSYNLRMGKSKNCGCIRTSLATLNAPLRKSKRAMASSIKDKTPKRREEKRMNQMKYVVSEKALLAHLHRWFRKKKNKINLTDKEFLDFRKIPCSSCGCIIEGLGIGFILIKPRRTIELTNMVPMCGVCRLIKPKEQFNPVEFSKKILRRWWKKTPMASIAKQKSKRSRGRFECARCKELFSINNMQLDHRIPVVDIERGFETLEIFVDRLFCDDSNLDMLCKPCHYEKTSLENEIREENKARRSIKNVKRSKATKRRSADSSERTSNGRTSKVRRRKINKVNKYAA